MNDVIYSVNGKYFLDYGVHIQASVGLLDKPKPKPRKSYDWAEYHGKAIDLSRPKYEERDISLKGWIEGDNWQDMKAKFDVFLAEFDKEGLARLIIEFGDVLVYDVYLSDSVELEKRFKRGKSYGVFTLKLKEPCPIKKVLKVIGDDFYISLSSPSWVELNIDGVSESIKGDVTKNKTLPDRSVGKLIGSRNLMRNSRLFIMNGNDRKNSDNENAGVIRVKDTQGEWNAYTWITLTEPHNVGEEVVFSIDLKSSKDCNVLFRYIAYYDLNYIQSTASLTANQWKRVSVKGVIKEKNSKKSLISLEGSSMANAVLEFRNAKIEVGNKPTEWTIAPEDVHYIIISGNIDEITNLQTNAEELWSL